MLAAKQVADLITGGRAARGLVMIWLGLTWGQEALPLICWLMILAWSGDALDGPIARRSRIQSHSWLGDHDLEVEIGVSFGLLLYLVAAHYVDLRIASVHLIF